MLDKERLCKAITGKEWKEVVEVELVDDPDFFSAQEQLASYLVAQLGVFSKMATGRSYVGDRLGIGWG